MRTAPTQTARQTALRIARRSGLNVTQKLFALFDLFGSPVNACVDMAREAARDVGLNATSAEIAFYRWGQARAGK